MMAKAKEKPIIFSTLLIPAIQNLKPNTWPPEPIDPGKPWKYMTRRVIKPQPVLTDNAGFCYKGQCYGMNIIPLIPNVRNFIECCCPYPPGTRLYVKEAWAWLPSWNCDNNMCNCETVYKDELGCFNYRANYGTTRDDSFPPDTFKWKSSRFMPKAAARLFLEVKDARAERVQAITGLDCAKEGVAKTMESLDEALCDFCPLPKELQGTRGIPSGYTSCEGSECSEAYKTYLEESAIDEFADIWDELYAKRGYPWENNDWVWVYEFMRTEVSAP